MNISILFLVSEWKLKGAHAGGDCGKKMVVFYHPTSNLVP